MGPAVFFGLSAFVLVTQGEPETVWLDPAETMDMVAAVAHDQPGDDAGALVVADISQVVPTAGAVPPARRMGVPLPQATLDARFAGVAVLPTPLVSEISGRLPGAVESVPARVLVRPDELPVLAAPPGLPLAAPVRFLPPVAPHQRAAVTGDLVRVRAAPGLDAAILESVNTGDLGLVLEHGPGWTLVQFPRSEGPLTGWVSVEFLAVQG